MNTTLVSNAARRAMFLLLSAVFVAANPPTGSSAPPVSPSSRMIQAKTVVRWSDLRGWKQWKAINECRLSTVDKKLEITSTGPDPHLAASVSLPIDLYRIVVHFRIVEGAATPFSVYWSDDARGSFSEARRIGSKPLAGSQWQTLVFALDRPSRITALRFDPGTVPSQLVVREIRVERVRCFPLSITQVRQTEHSISFCIQNDSKQTVAFDIGTKHLALEARQSHWYDMPMPSSRFVSHVALAVRCEGWPELRRTAYVINPKSDEPVFETALGSGIRLRIARNGTAAWLLRNETLLAALAPLAAIDGVPLVAERTEAGSRTWRFAIEGTRWHLAVESGHLRVRIEGDSVVEGPVVRSFGRLEQAVFAGVEYLGRGESSSSKLDIETKEHLRYSPDPLDVAWPLMSCMTERAAVSVVWNVEAARPTFAVPDVFDGVEGQRMALHGRVIDARVRVADESLEQAIVWGVTTRGLPALPPPPLDASATRELDLVGLTKSIASPNGWSHAAGGRWPFRFYADMASTLWRLGGPLPQDRSWQIGGAHIPNEAIFFVTDQVERWVEMRGGVARHAQRSQQPDGSFRYRGKYARGHFEDTASGYCAASAVRLLDWAYYTGDAGAREAGCRALEFMQRFRTPRGAQTWEIPLHTPDLLASAHLVHAYVRGFQLTGDERYLESARKWAVSGLPFVYLRDDGGALPYATIAVFGATNWRSPNWIGLPVQWVGIVYAHSLALLAPYDDSLDWRHIATGILRCGRQMQYPAGPVAGLLPDSYDLRSRKRRPPDINPCSLVSLELVLDGQVDSLAVASDTTHRIVGPFPMKLTGGKVEVEGRVGTTYQLLVDGSRIVRVRSQGRDVIELEP